MKTQKILESQYFSLKSETTEWRRCDATALMGFCLLFECQDGLDYWFCFPVAVNLINGDET